MSTYFSQTIPDPFVVTSNLIDPLRVSDDIPDDSYSIKTVVYNPLTRSNQIDIVSGTLNRDSISNMIGFQNDIKNIIQNTLRIKFKKSEYDIGSNSNVPDFNNIPNLNLYNQREFLIYFNDSNDYFLVNMNNIAGFTASPYTPYNPENRVLGFTFYTAGASPQYFPIQVLNYDTDTITPVSLISSETSATINSYEVKFAYREGTSNDPIIEIVANTEDGVKTIILQMDDYDPFPTVDDTLTQATVNGNNMSFNTTTVSGNTFEFITSPNDYNTLSVIRHINYNAVKTLTSTIYLTYIIQNFIDGLFITHDLNRSTIADILSFIGGTYSFSTIETKYIECLVNLIYNSIINSINHILGSGVLFSSNRGFATSSSMRGFALEIKLN